MLNSIKGLRQQLTETTDPVNRLDVMIALARRMQRSAPAEALKLAAKARRLAVTRKDRLRTARSTVALGFCEHNLSNYAAALRHFRKALQLCDRSVDPETFARALQGIGITYTGTGEFPKAIEALSKALECASESGNLIELCGFIHNSIGVVHRSLGDYTRALEHCRESRKLFEEVDSRTGLVFTINNLGTVYLALEDLEQAREQFVRGAEIAILLEDRRSEAVTVLNLGVASFRLGQYEEALRNYMRALQLSRQMGEQSLVAQTLRYIGAFHQHRREFDRALENFQAALEIAERTGDAFRWIYLTMIAAVHIDRSEYTEAIEVLLTALRGVYQQGDRDSEFQIHRDLSICYEATGDLARAFEHHKLYTQIKEEVVGQQRQREMIQMQMRSEIERSEKEREILRLEKQRLEQEMEHKSKELTAMALHLVEKNQFLATLKREMADVVETVDVKARSAVRGLMRQVEGNSSAKEDWKAFESQFEKVHHGFIRTLSQRYPELSRTELKVCTLLKINMSSKEISEFLRASARTVDNHRYHIRKKLGLPEDVSLATFLASL